MSKKRYGPEFTCANCGKKSKYFNDADFKKRSSPEACCSKKCAGDLRKKYTELNCICETCGKKFHKKHSQLKKSKLQYCSRKCMYIHYTERYLGNKNPNYQAKQTDGDGYLLAHLPTVGRVRLHHWVASQTLGVDITELTRTKKYHVHHRDCDITNNAKENLAVLSIPDHQWLHKNFGNVTL